MPTPTAIQAERRRLLSELEDWAERDSPDGKDRVLTALRACRSIGYRGEAGRVSVRVAELA